MEYGDYFTSDANDTCKQHSNDNCFCYEQESCGDLRSWISVITTSILSYFCWFVFVNILKCETELKCVFCLVIGKINEKIRSLRSNQNSSDMNDSVVLIQQQNEQPKAIFSWKALIHMCLILFALVIWIFFVAFIGYEIDDADHIYLRWPVFYGFTSFVSLVASIFSLWHGETNNWDIAAHVGLLILGFSQIFSNLPNTSIKMDTATHARRLISTEYTLFLWFCCFFSIFTFKFVMKKYEDIENTENSSEENNQEASGINESRFASFKRQCRGFLSLLCKSFKNEIKNVKTYVVSLCTRNYAGRDTTLFKDEKINMLLRIFSFVWSANLLREFLNLVVDYEKFEIIYIWEELESNENKMLLFSCIVVIISFINSSFCQFEYYSVDQIYLTLAYVTFFQIIYYFRVVLIYQEQRWLISDVTEIFIGHMFIVIGIWFLFYLNEKQNHEGD